VLLVFLETVLPLVVLPTVLVAVLPLILAKATALYRKTLLVTR